MNHSNQPTNVPATPNRLTKARRFAPSLPIEIPGADSVSAQAQINTVICNCESEATYYTALAALKPVADRLERGSGQYWINGKLCRTLDQVVNSLIEIPTQYPGQ